MTESEAKGLALDAKRELLRHVVATVAYRGGIAVSDAPEAFAGFRIDETARTIYSKCRFIWSGAN